MSHHKPFNDAIDHMRRVEGAPVGRGGRLPKPIKFIGYFLFGGMFIMTGIIIFLHFFHG
ncbi:hypothetical protein [Virgibacillus sp. MSP4-1]|uniref:hypothetical protein n=1 Tax=Virgibacillus sp. MSP4-1 TaxID=2700081 RepID=UPI00039B4439|nr:hypothetical protein [Virgibacillus sp. MSP4-1]